MSAAFHRGVTQDLRAKLQTAGIRIEEQDAQKALAGAPVVGVNSSAKDTITRITDEVWYNRFWLMERWENDHPGVSPFPPIFAEVVLNLLRLGAGVQEDSDLLVAEVIKLAEAELEL